MHGTLSGFIKDGHRTIVPLDPILLPDIAAIHMRAKALAMIEAIVSPDWGGRYFSFNANWREGEELASLRNGSGDDWYLHFGTFGAAIKGLAHETSLAGNKVLTAAVQSQVPNTFDSFLKEPAFGMDWLSYCYWRSPDDSSWQKVISPNSSAADIDDGSEEFLALLFEPASSYVEFAHWYYEIEISLESVERIYKHECLTDELLSSLNPELAFSEAKKFAAEIVYPSALPND